VQEEFGVDQDELSQYMSDHSYAQNFDPNDSASSFDEEEHTWVNSIQCIMKDEAAVQQHHSRLLLSDEIVAMTDLYAMLNRRGIPHHLFDTLSKWA
jgi:hypothetical protein